MHIQGICRERTVCLWNKMAAAAGSNKASKNNIENSTSDFMNESAPKNELLYLIEHAISKSIPGNESLMSKFSLSIGFYVKSQMNRQLYGEFLV